LEWKEREEKSRKKGDKNILKFSIFRLAFSMLFYHLPDLQVILIFETSNIIPKKKIYFLYCSGIKSHNNKLNMQGLIQYTS
jgi:hypothetical protein